LQTRFALQVHHAANFGVFHGSQLRGINLTRLKLLTGFFNRRRTQETANDVCTEWRGCTLHEELLNNIPPVAKCE
jgi:hypothetical protein